MLWFAPYISGSHKNFLVGCRIQSEDLSKEKEGFEVIGPHSINVKLPENQLIVGNQVVVNFLA